MRYFAKSMKKVHCPGNGKTHQQYWTNIEDCGFILKAKTID